MVTESRHSQENIPGLGREMLTALSHLNSQVLSQALTLNSVETLRGGETAPRVLAHPHEHGSAPSAAAGTELSPRLTPDSLRDNSGFS